MAGEPAPQPPPPAQPEREALLADYVAAEDALRAFTDRNFGRMCAICARWTLLAARANEAAAPAAPVPGRRALPVGGGGQPVSWRLSSWVTNCCNANHALESMSETSLAGIVASREEGREWWLKVKRASAAPCAALTDGGCYLQRGRPELCNKYFCEAIRDYLWLLGGERAGADLAARLDELQRRWATLYGVYQHAIAAPNAAPGGYPPQAAVRAQAQWERFFTFVEEFDRRIARLTRPISAGDVAHRLFKVEGDEALYEPFFEREVTAIDGHIRR